MKDKIIIKGAREHNLKNIDVEIPKYKLVVFTGLSGSGKSSLAFDTIYAEGQRRYVESLSSYARQFLGIMKKPDVDYIEGLSPAISIDQKGASHNPRSTVGTVTEIYDYLRLLFARIGHPHCLNCGREITHLSREQILNEIVTNYLSFTPVKIMVLAPLIKARKGEYLNIFKDLKSRGFQKVRIDNHIYSLNDDFVLIKTNKHTIEAVIDRMILDKKSLDKQRLLESIEQGLNLGNGEITISKVLDKTFSFPENPKNMEDTLYSEKFACINCGLSIHEIEPRLFSFNSPQGACPKCNGIGYVYKIDEKLVLNNNLTINEGGIMPYGDISEKNTWFARTVMCAFEKNSIPLKITLEHLTQEEKNIVLYGTGDRIYEVQGLNRFGEETIIHEPFQGVINELTKRFSESGSDLIRHEIEKYMREEVCVECNGYRLKKEAQNVKILNHSIVDVANLSIGETLEFMNKMYGNLNDREKEISKIILKEINSRLRFLVDVGLAYLTLARSANTLAGGETQRIRLASQIGSGLSGVLYVLDEPSIGLHPRDNLRLIDSLKKLRDIGNSVIVVEHDKEMMLDSDYILDFGPGAGIHGGKIIALGTPVEIKKNKNSITGPYLSGNKKISIKKEKSADGNSDLFYSAKKNNGHLNSIKLTGVSEHNLKNINVNFPLGSLICITGVSGSGKSTLINDVLYHALMQKRNPYHKEIPGKFEGLTGDDDIKRVFLIDQSPIGRTPRSNPVTYTGAFTYIREIFSNTHEARLRGYGPGRFSFNVRGGRCETCEGAGELKIEMQFLADVYIKCEACQGKRYTQDTLEIDFEGKNIYEVLDMTVEEAMKFFSFFEPLKNKLETLYDVGLSYIKLGQPATTLSGGEAQRVKLAAELSKKGGGGSLYLLDEPTTGLHFADLEKLVIVLRRLVKMGNTIIVIEHNLDVIKNADYVIDLGPEGGEQGGEIIACGSPDEISKSQKSYTGIYLKKELVL